MKRELQMHLAELQSLHLKDKSNSRRHLWLIRQSASFDTRPGHPASDTDGLSETNLLVRFYIFHVSTIAQSQPEGGASLFMRACT